MKITNRVGGTVAIYLGQRPHLVLLKEDLQELHELLSEGCERGLDECPCYTRGYERGQESK